MQFTVPLPTMSCAVPLVVWMFSGITRRVYEENSLALPVTCRDTLEFTIHSSDLVVDMNARACVLVSLVECA
jgi:hypothetical protein